MTLQELAKEIRQVNIDHGFNVDGSRPFTESLCLMHEELSEALGEWRNNHNLRQYYYTVEGKPEGVPFELADAIIRILDEFAVLGIDPEWFIKEKISYNRTRPYKHGRLA